MMASARDLFTPITLKFSNILLNIEILSNFVKFLKNILQKFLLIGVLFHNYIILLYQITIFVVLPESGTTLKK